MKFIGCLPANILVLSWVIILGVGEFDVDAIVKRDLPRKILTLEQGGQGLSRLRCPIY